MTQEHESPWNAALDAAVKRIQDLNLYTSDLIGSENIQKTIEAVCSLKKPLTSPLKESPPASLHTPAPWASGGWSSNGTLCLGGGHGFIVATVHTPPYGHGHRLKTAEEAVAESKANSALIDSAPQLKADNAALVQALEWAMAEIDRLSNTHSGFGYPQGIVEHYPSEPERESAATNYHAARAALSSALVNQKATKA